MCREKYKLPVICVLLSMNGMGKAGPAQHEKHIHQRRLCENKSCYLDSATIWLRKHWSSLLAFNDVPYITGFAFTHHIPRHQQLVKPT